MNKKTIRAGIVGAGFAASFHFEAIKKVCSTNVDVKGVFSLDGAKEYAEKRGIAVYDSLQKLLDDVDIIHCCVTASSHESVAISEARNACVNNSQAFTGPEPVAPVEVGHRSCTVCLLGEIAMRLGRKLKWDPQKELFINDDEANRMLSRPMRSPWHL